MKKFRWGILGAGRIARNFAHDLHLLDDCELIGVGSNSQERADAWARENGAQRGYGSYEQLLDEGKPDAVYVATRHPQHLAAATLCLERGIPVLCEKPLAVNGAEVAQMIATARAHDTFLMEALWTRFLPSIRHAMEQIEAGEIGEVLGVKADFGFRREYDPSHRLFDPAKAGGALLDIGIYPLLLSYFILGTDPQKITAAATLSAGGVDLDTGILLEYADERMAHLHATIRTHTASDGFIYGTKANIHLHPRWHEAKSYTIYYHDGTDEVRYDFQQEFGDAYGYRFETAHVMECVRTGRTESPLVPWAFSEALMRGMDTIREQIGVRYPGE